MRGLPCWPLDRNEGDVESTALPGAADVTSRNHSNTVKNDLAIENKVAVCDRQQYQQT